MLLIMGGNGSYSKDFRGIPNVKRTHTDTNTRVDGHKVLLQKGNAKQSKNILNSNSESPIYLIAKVKDGVIEVQSINVFKKHEISLEINLEYDAKGNVIPFSEGNKRGSHAHLWDRDEMGNFNRKEHDRKNTFSIPPEYNKLIDDIVTYNRKGIKWL